MKLLVKVKHPSQIDQVAAGLRKSHKVEKIIYVAGLLVIDVVNSRSINVLQREDDIESVEPIEDRSIK